MFKPFVWNFPQQLSFVFYGVYRVRWIRQIWLLYRFGRKSLGNSLKGMRLRKGKCPSQVCCPVLIGHRTKVEHLGSRCPRFGERLGKRLQIWPVRDEWEKQTLQWLCHRSKFYLTNYSEGSSKRIDSSGTFAHKNVNLRLSKNLIFRIQLVVSINSVSINKKMQEY